MPAGSGERSVRQRLSAEASLENAQGGRGGDAGAAGAGLGNAMIEFTRRLRLALLAALRTHEPLPGKKIEGAGNRRNVLARDAVHDLLEYAQRGDQAAE